MGECNTILSAYTLYLIYGMVKKNKDTHKQHTKKMILYPRESLIKAAVFTKCPVTPSIEKKPPVSVKGIKIHRSFLPE